MLNQVQIYPIGDSISIHHLQIFQSRRIILMDHFQQLAAFQYTALGTGRETLANGAVPDFALGTMAQFNAGLHASGAIDRLNRDIGRIELHLPFFGCFCT